MELGKFKKVNMDLDRHVILHSPIESNAYLKIDQETFFKNLLATTSVYQKAMIAVGLLDQGSLTRIKGLPDSIYPTRHPKSFCKAMQRKISSFGQRCTTRSICQVM
jgi:hypothetical protein